MGCGPPKGMKNAKDFGFVTEASVCSPCFSWRSRARPITGPRGHHGLWFAVLFQGEVIFGEVELAQSAGRLMSGFRGCGKTLALEGYGL